MTDEKREDVQHLAEEETQMPLMIDEASAEDVRSVGGRVRRGGADEDDETWTNQPSAAEPDLGEDLEEQEVEEDDESEPSRMPRKAIETGRDVVCEELPDRAQRAAVRLKPFLTAAVVFEFTGSGEKYLFDWRGDTPTTKQLPKAMVVTFDEEQGYVSSESAMNVDTVVCISESHLMAVRSGALNPQVGMLTEKIRVKGKVGPAVYIFNLVAPRARP
jgi:hypothetical protein